jgi:hypothetical protein
MPMTSISHRGLHFAAWVLAVLLTAPPAAATDDVDVRVVTGLPRVGIAESQTIAWRSIGVLVESNWLDAEMKFASCLPVTTIPVVPADRPGSACSVPAGALTRGDRGHSLALTFKVPRGSDGAPLVDLALRSWRAPTQGAMAGGRRDGTVAELVVTQPVGTMDTFLGYSTPVTQAQAASPWRSTFAGITWYAAPGTRFDLVADRGVDTTTATIDRTLTLRLAHVTAARNTRFTAWTTRAIDDRRDPWQVGGGIEVAF